MKNQVVVIIAVLSVLALSCKKKSEEPIPTPVPVVKANYFQLKVGNYWIYQGFHVDTNGIATPTGDFDSAYIEKDTVMRGFTYYKLIERQYLIMPQWGTFLRDSSGYLVTAGGYVIASDCNFTDILAVDTSSKQIYVGSAQMTGRDSLVVSPAGTFQSITWRNKIVPVPPNPMHWPVRYAYDVYGKGVGKMKSSTFFFSASWTIESWLVRYKVN